MVDPRSAGRRIGANVANNLRKKFDKVKSWINSGNDKSAGRVGSNAVRSGRSDGYSDDSLTHDGSKHAAEGVSYGEASLIAGNDIQQPDTYHPSLEGLSFFDEVKASENSPGGVHMDDSVSAQQPPQVAPTVGEDAIEGELQNSAGSTDDSVAAQLPLPPPPSIEDLITGKWDQEQKAKAKTIVDTGGTGSSRSTQPDAIPAKKIEKPVSSHAFDQSDIFKRARLQAEEHALHSTGTGEMETRKAAVAAEAFARAGRSSEVERPPLSAGDREKAMKEYMAGQKQIAAVQSLQKDLQAELTQRFNKRAAPPGQEVELGAKKERLDNKPVVAKKPEQVKRNKFFSMLKRSGV